MEGSGSSLKPLRGLMPDAQQIGALPFAVSVLHTSLATGLAEVIAHLRCRETLGTRTLRRSRFCCFLGPRITFEPHGRHKLHTGRSEVRQLPPLKDRTLYFRPIARRMFCSMVTHNDFTSPKSNVGPMPMCPCFAGPWSL